LTAIKLWVYGDESGLDSTTPYSLVAGWIGSPAKWCRFRNEWRKVVDTYEDVPKDKTTKGEFHAIHFFARHEAQRAPKKRGRNPYRDWEEQRAQDYLDALLKVIARNDMVKPVGAALDNRLFYAYTWGERNYLTGALWDEDTKKFVTQGAPSRTYHVPFLELVRETLRMATAPDSKVHFVMDEQKVIAEGLAQSWAYARRGKNLAVSEYLRAKMGDLTWAISNEQEGIQAADLLAYAWFGWYRERERLSGDRRKAVDQLWTIHKREPGLIRTRLLEWYFDTTLVYPEDRALIRAYPSPADRQRAKRL
jgi:hypothetical protein